MATITSSVSYNNKTSHLVGKSGGNIRYETASFSIPAMVDGKTVVSAKITEIELDKTYMNCRPGESSKGSPTTYYNISSSIEHSSSKGTIENSTSSANIKLYPNTTLLPGTYYLSVYPASNTENGYWRYFPNTSSGFTATLTVEYIHTTACGQPGWASISGYAAPTDPITVTWGSGTEGNNNKIKGYHVVIKNDYGTILGDTETSGASTTSCSVSPYTNWGSGGTHLHCEVKTCGEASENGEYDSQYTTGGSLTVNSVPEITSITISLPYGSSSENNKIPSSGGEVDFKILASDGEDSLTYSMSLNGNPWESCPGSEFTYVIPKNTTNNEQTYAFQFRAYDNRQYSVPKTCTITVNNIKEASISGSISDKKVSCDQKNYEKYKVKVSSFVGSSLFDDWISNELDTYQFSFSDLRQYASMKNGKLMIYSIQMQYFDGIDWSNWSDKINTTYQAPTFSLMDGDKRVYSTVTLKYEGDKGVFFSVSNTNETWVESKSQAENMTLSTRDLQWSTKNTTTKLTTIYARTSQSSNSIKIDINDLGLWKVRQIPIQGDSSGTVNPISGKIYLFDNQKIITIKLYLPKTDWYYMGIAEAPYLYLLYGQNEIEIKPSEDTNQTSEYILYKITPRKLCSDFNITSNQSTITQLTFKIKNLKKESFEADWPVTVDYNVDAQLVQYTYINWPRDIMQNSELKLEVKVATVNDTPSTFGLGLPFWTFYGWYKDREQLTDETWEYEEAYFSIKPQYYKYSITFLIDQEVRQNYSSSNFNPYLFMNNNKIHALASFDIWKHYPGLISLTSYECGNNSIIISWKIDDWGIDNSKIKQAEILLRLKEGGYLHKQEDGKYTEVKFTLAANKEGQWVNTGEGEQECSFGYYNKGTFTSQDTLQLAPVLKVWINDEKTKNVKETTNYNYVLIYNQLPTIAYRKNNVGFNTSNPSNYQINNNDVAMVVCKYQDRDKIVFAKDQNNKFYFDLTNGCVVNLIIDGGTW